MGVGTTVKVGDYVGFKGRSYAELRGIVLEGPRRAPGTMHHKQFRVKWFESTTPPHWNPRPTGSWEFDHVIKVLSSMETKCQ